MVAVRYAAGVVYADDGMFSMAIVPFRMVSGCNVTTTRVALRCDVVV